ncbi:hypothetical protein F8M41_000942 [Gigaspora margarita]|uniref:Uncharacterized protein n=2 Tax=Gigaspora margarita TaxID=4874 RepID=A0A8H3XHK5_GIGMA|nr:hypothetical protein F8M41_000942 [Gigaspora margarita]
MLKFYHLQSQLGLSFCQLIKIFHIKIEEVNEVNEDMLIDGNVDSLDLNDELVNNDVYNDLTEIEQDKKDGNQK